MGLTPYKTDVISFAAFADIWSRIGPNWHGSCLFSLPFWLEAVQRHLGTPGEPHLVAVYNSEGPIGIMPLALASTTAVFLGDPEVCDYQDCLVAPGQAAPVLAAVVEHLRAKGIARLDLGTLRPDAMVVAAMDALGLNAAGGSPEQVDVTHETKLPDTWAGFLQQLNGKQRHEVRRKVRRLESQARIRFRVITRNHAIDAAADDFIALFRRNREDKKSFMSDQMAGYFKSLMRNTAKWGLIRLCFLEVNERPAAGVLCFDHEGVRYLYNSGYDDKYEHLSVGILSKVFAIQNAIEMGCRGFDFLKGAETYKKRIGGQETPLYRHKIDL